MPRGLQALVLRATLLAISARVTIGQGSFLQMRTAADREGIEEDVDCTIIQNKSAQSYILLGPMDSGTNLIHQLMHTAWPTQVCMESYHTVWKHALTGVDDIYHFALNYKSRDALRNIVLVHTVRSPLAQLASWRKAPYELEECVVRDVQDWGKACMARMGPYHPNEGATPEEYIGGTQPTWYESTMDIYNQYLQQLADFREKGWFKAVVAVSYEDMLLSPAKVLTDIAQHFEGLGEVNVQEVQDALLEPAKFEAGTVDEAKEKLMETSYLEEFSRANMAMVCEGLNRTLVEQHKVGTFLDPSRQRSYWADCGGVREV